MISNTLPFGIDSDSVALYRMHNTTKGSDMTKLRNLIDRIDRWTIEVFNPQGPLARR